MVAQAMQVMHSTQVLHRFLFYNIFRCLKVLHNTVVDQAGSVMWTLFYRIMLVIVTMYGFVERKPAESAWEINYIVCVVMGQI